MRKDDCISDTLTTWRSIIYFLEEILKFIVPSGSPVVQTAVDEVIAEGLYFVAYFEATL